MPTRCSSRRRRCSAERRPAAIAAAGLLAGCVATAVQIGLWWLTAAPVVDLLVRDTRLTAAIVLGPAVLPGTAAAPLSASIVAVATLLHFSLALIYAALLDPLVGGLRRGAALLAGGAYGLALYAINLYGFTALFPWFAVSRGAITLLTHLAFGATLAAALVAWRQR